MLRVRTSLAPIALVLGALSLTVLSSTSALADCDSADLCTAGECRLRQANVHPTCDQPRSCGSIDASDKTELHNRLMINQQCLAARMNVSQCFSTSDTGHDQAIQAVRNAIATCQYKYDQK